MSSQGHWPPVSPPQPMADSYLDLDFSPEPANINPGAYWDILIYVTRSDRGIEP